MNNQVQFVCLWCWAQTDFVVQINNFFSLILCFAVIHKRRGKELINKTMKYNLDSCSKMQFSSFYQFFFFFLENYRFCRKSANGANSRRWWWGGHTLCFIMVQGVGKSICDSPLRFLSTFFHKRNTYQHTQHQIKGIFKHKLSITELSALKAIIHLVRWQNFPKN